MGLVNAEPGGQGQRRKPGREAERGRQRQASFSPGDKGAAPCFPSPTRPPGAGPVPELSLEEAAVGQPAQVLLGLPGCAPGWHPTDRQLSRAGNRWLTHGWGLMRLANEKSIFRGEGNQQNC